MDYNENKTICPICGKCCFKTKGEINDFNRKRNRAHGGDSYRTYYSKECRCWHLTTTPSISAEIHKHIYNRSQEKQRDYKNFRTYGLVA